MIILLMMLFEAERFFGILLLEFVVNCFVFGNRISSEEVEFNVLSMFQFICFQCATNFLCLGVENCFEGTPGKWLQMHLVPQKVYHRRQ